MSKEEFWQKINEMSLDESIIKYAKEEEKDVDEIYTYAILYKNITELMLM